MSRASRLRIAGLSQPWARPSARRFSVLSSALLISLGLGCSDAAVERQRAASLERAAPAPVVPAPAAPQPAAPEPAAPEVAAPAPAAPELAAAAPPRADGPDRLAAEDVVAAINAYRTANQLPSLELDPRLLAAARVKLADMQKRGYFDHVDPDGREVWAIVKQTGCRYRAAAENLASGYGDARAMADGWMRSRAHRDNILNRRYRVAGIAASPTPPSIAVVLFADSCG